MFIIKLIIKTCHITQTGDRVVCVLLMSLFLYQTTLRVSPLKEGLLAK